MRSQWYIAVIAIVLGTGLAIGIDRLSGSHHTNDVKLNLSQQTTSSEDTSSTILDSTTLPGETTLPNLAADALANTPGSPSTHHASGGGGGGGGTHNGTPTRTTNPDKGDKGATTVPSGPATTQHPPNCADYKGTPAYDYCLQRYPDQRPHTSSSDTTEKPPKTSTTSGDF